MKTLKSMIAVIALLFVGAAANASVKTVGGNSTKDDAINTYINAVTSGKADDVATELDNDMQFNLHRGDNVNTMNKIEFLDNLKDAGATQPTDTKTTVIEDDGGPMAKIKVEFKYDGFARTDIVTLNKSTGWMITNIDSTTK